VLGLIELAPNKPQIIANFTKAKVLNGRGGEFAKFVVLNGW
jgi:hypothetical protein